MAKGGGGGGRSMIMGAARAAGARVRVTRINYRGKAGFLARGKTSRGTQLDIFGDARFVSRVIRKG